jgi:Zn-dependent protease
MNRPFTIGTLFGSNLRLHWSLPLLPVGVAIYSAAMFSWWQAAFYVLIVLAVYLSVLAHEGIQLLAARRFGLGTRDVTLYPFWAVARLTQMSERPWPEIPIAASGPVVLALLTTTIGAALAIAGAGIAFPENVPEPTVVGFLTLLFWANLALTAIHVLPMLPLDGGRALRAYLAMRTSRLQATEVTATISTLGSLVLLVAAIVWLRSPLVGATAVLIYLGAQEDLGTSRYFASLREPPSSRAHVSPLLVPMDQIVTPDCLPDEPNFSGFTWNARARLWIEWRDGEPVGANALIGDDRP